MRSPVLAALLAASLTALAVAPAFAGPSEAAFLNRLAGSWLGKGKLTGTETGPVACRLEFKSAGNRISYVGRCNIQDLGGQSFSGSIGYNDATKAYEVRSLAGSYVGTRKGELAGLHHQDRDLRRHHHLDDDALAQRHHH